MMAGNSDASSSSAPSMTIQGDVTSRTSSWSAALLTVKKQYNI
jgi:hypothetical protein